MAIALTAPPPRSSPLGQGDVYDPILDKLATTNTFDCDWPTLRHHLHLALLSAVPLFLSLGPPPPLPSAQSPEAQPAQTSPASPPPSPPPGSEAGIDDDDKPPAQSPLLSPSNPTALLDTTRPSGPSARRAVTPRSVDVEPPSSPSQPRIANLRDASDMQPSTPGGLIIPPFPPFEPNRRRRGSGGAIPFPNIQPRTNGVGHPQSPAIVINRGLNMFEDDWDEDLVIGGKRMPAWMEEEEGQKEVESLGRLLEGMEYPPFTIQRIAELLFSPTAQHSSLGKFLRALEKALLVNTPWEPPSYTYIPGSTIPAARSLFGGSSSASSASDDGDSDSTMPPGSATPMFSPIPFLVRSGSENGGDLRMGMEGIEEGHTNGRSVDEGLMSPLMLGGDSPNPSGAFRFAPTPNVRSPTPEPEEVASEPHFSGSDSSDPGHQPYLGRVDELDTGPVRSDSAVRTNGHKGSDHDDPGAGSGEGGNMTPHGMRERPVPISSTTTMGESGRRVAGMPRGGLDDRFVAGQSEDEEVEQREE